MKAVWPIALNIHSDGRVLAIEFDNGKKFELSAEYLRVESPSAEVRGHGAGDKKIETGKENVRIIAAEAVGNYAVRLRFDDGHDTGIYTWPFLFQLGRDYDSIWAAYLDAVAAKNAQGAASRFS